MVALVKWLAGVAYSAVKWVVVWGAKATLWAITHPAVAIVAGLGAVAGGMYLASSDSIFIQAAGALVLGLGWKLATAATLVFSGTKLVTTVVELGSGVFRDMWNFALGVGEAVFLGSVRAR